MFIAMLYVYCGCTLRNNGCVFTIARLGVLQGVVVLIKFARPLLDSDAPRPAKAVRLSLS